MACAKMFDAPRTPTAMQTAVGTARSRIAVVRPRAVRRDSEKVEPYRGSRRETASRTKVETGRSRSMVAEKVLVLLLCPRGNYVD